MNCYLCKANVFAPRKGRVRDAPELEILECANCGLVTLSSLDHIKPGFYEESGMHGDQVLSIEAWLKDTHWDDHRRFSMLKPMLTNKKLLDFGCGAGGFLSEAEGLVESVTGIELEARVRDYWKGRFRIVPGIGDVLADRFDLITAFHVIEHLPDPRDILKSLAKVLARNGRLVIEVPNAEDALLSIYKSEAFQRFTYWSQHLFLFNAETLRRLAEQAGLCVVSIQQCQRYPLSNHLYWLSQSKPGGHQEWSFLDTPELNRAYGQSLAAIGKCDTLIAYLEVPG
jgi:2-polyprenyl-3-methyl-5-hydroxy-6-metoxy-1,4-benzoquinol methylase